MSFDVVRKAFQDLVFSKVVAQDSLPKLMLRTFGDYLTERTF